MLTTYLYDADPLLARGPTSRTPHALSWVWMADQPVAEFSSATPDVLLATDASLSPALEIAEGPLSVVYAPHGHRATVSTEAGRPAWHRRDAPHKPVWQMSSTTG